MSPARLPRPWWPLAPLLLILPACGGGGSGGSPGGEQAPGDPAGAPAPGVTFPRSGDGYTVLQDSTDAECAGLLPDGPLPASVTRSRTVPTGTTCGPGLSDGTGHVALGARDAASLWTWQDRAAGTLCGRVTFREATLGCTSGALDQAWDGTVVRQSAREDCSGGGCTCSHQWWPRLLAGP